MVEFTNMDLIAKARSVVHPQQVGDRLFGDVGCALLTEGGNLYLGVCIDTGSGTGFCAEHSAIAAMVTAGEYRIKKIVAVWLNGEDVYVLSPCGRCREFIRQVDPANLGTEIVMDAGFSLKLSDLLPYADWFQRILRDSAD
jgi:cytidine deaminase